MSEHSVCLDAASASHSTLTLLQPVVYLFDSSLCCTLFEAEPTSIDFIEGFWIQHVPLSGELHVKINRAVSGHCRQDQVSHHVVCVTSLSQRELY